MITDLPEADDLISAPSASQDTPDSHNAGDHEEIIPDPSGEMLTW